MLGKDLKIGDKLFFVEIDKMGILEITLIQSMNDGLRRACFNWVLDPGSRFSKIYTNLIMIVENKEVHYRDQNVILTANEQEAVDFLREQLKNVS